MSSIRVQDIQRDVAIFLKRVEAGESFLVVDGEHTLAIVQPVPAPATQPRPFGLCAGQFTVPADFDRPLPDEILQRLDGA